MRDLHPNLNNFYTFFAIKSIHPFYNFLIPNQGETPGMLPQHIPYHVIRLHTHRIVGTESLLHHPATHHEHLTSVNITVGIMTNKLIQSI